MLSYSQLFYVILCKDCNNADLWNIGILCNYKPCGSVVLGVDNLTFEGGVDRWYIKNTYFARIRVPKKFQAHDHGRKRNLHTSSQLEKGMWHGEKNIHACIHFTCHEKNNSQYMKGLIKITPVQNQQSNGLPRGRSVIPPL